MNYRLIILSVILFCCLGCGGNTVVPDTSVPNGYIALNNTTYNGIEVSHSTTRLNVTFSSVGSAGCFIRVPLDAGQYLASQEWSDEKDVLHLAVWHDTGIEIGVVPLTDDAGGSIAASFELTGVAPKTPSIPPYRDDNQILHQVFEISPYKENEVVLEWPQVNVGDYDYNGEVSVSDLVPVAMYYLHVYDRADAGAPETPEFWIDGDRNGLINMGDLVTIAQHYNSVVAGYKVEKNGEVLEIGSAANPTVLSTHTLREADALPPLYYVVTEGSLEDTWDVIPVDTDGQPGTSLQEVVEKVANVKAAVKFSGIDLIPLNSNLTNQLGDGCSLLRIIEEGEIINGAEYSDGFFDEDSSSYFFYGIPRDKLVFLEVLYYPAVDPTNGQARTSPPGGEGTEVPLSSMTRTTVPFILPERTSLQKLEVEIRFEEKPTGGCYIYTQTQYEPQQPFLERFLHPAISTSYLDPAKSRIVRFDGTDGMVAWDQDAQGHYDLAPTLRDENYNSISSAFATQLRDFLSYTKTGIEIGSLTGRVESLDEASGLIKLASPIAITAYDEYTISSRDLYFSESAFFIEQQTIDGYPYSVRFDPSSLAPGDLVILEVDFLGGEAPNWDKIWVRQVTRVTPEQTADI